MRLSIQRSLLLAFAGLILFVCAVVVVLSLRQQSHFIRDTSREVLQRAQVLADVELRRLFDPIRTELAVNVREASLGLLDRNDPIALKDHFLSRMAHLRGVGSLMVGDPSGYQFLVMQYDSLVTRSPLLADQPDLPAVSGAGRMYLTREFRPADWGEESRWTIWDPSGRTAVQRFSRQLPGYNPRERLWHTQAMARLAEIEAQAAPASTWRHVAWTDVYTLFTSKTPGISASAAVRTPDGGTTIVAYDVLLEDLSSFTRLQRPARGGKVFVFTDEGLLLGLPADDRFESEEARLAALLRPLGEVGGEPLEAWSQEWTSHRQEASKTFRYRAAGEAWWGSFQAHRLDANRRLWVGVAVPEHDLLHLTGHRPGQLVPIAVVALLLAMLLASWISRSVSNPLRELVAQSQRIGALDLAEQAPPRSGLAEVQDLGTAVGSMRLALVDHMEYREMASAALRESEEVFRATFEQAAVGVLHASIDGRFLLVNERMAQITGRSREELLDSGIQEITHPEDRPLDAERMRAFLTEGVDDQQWEKRYVRPDGGVVWVLVTAKLRRDPQGNPMHFVTIVQDIGEQKELEQSLWQSQKLEAVGRLAGGVAHDFNNLLTVIRGYVSLARQRLGASDPSNADLGEVERAAVSAASLTRQLLAFARKDVASPEVVDAGEAVREHDSMIRRLINEHVELELEIEDSDHRVFIDPVQLQQVLVNLAVNARDAMPRGGKLVISVRNRSLEDADWVEISVRDTGTGMKPETLTRAFEPFFTTKEVGQGTGLGLSTCYGIIENAGGQIGIESQWQGGTTATVRLPRSQSQPETSDPEHAENGPAGGDEVILIVEDDSQIRELLERVFARAGYRILAAANGLDAMELIKVSGRVDLVVTDVVMPGLSGGTLARLLRMEMPDLPVLFMSGHTREILDDRIPNETDLLHKPFTPDQILERVRLILDQARSRQG